MHGELLRQRHRAASRDGGGRVGAGVIHCVVVVAADSVLLQYCRWRIQWDEDSSTTKKHKQNHDK